jgi:hypothetical protein
VQGVLKRVPALESGQARQPVQRLAVGFVQQFFLNGSQQFLQRQVFLFHIIPDFGAKLQNNFVTLASPDLLFARKWKEKRTFLFISLTYLVTLQPER